MYVFKHEMCEINELADLTQLRLIIASYNDMLAFRQTSKFSLDKKKKHLFSTTTVITLLHVYNIKRKFRHALRETRANIEIAMLAYLNMEKMNPVAQLFETLIILKQHRPCGEVL